MGSTRAIKNGFTMIELLATILIIGILSFVGIVSFMRYRDNQREIFNNNQNKIFVELAKTYFEDNPSMFPKNPLGSEFVTLKELRENNYVTEDFLDYDHKKFSDESKVTVTRIGNGLYVYKGHLITSSGDSYDTEKSKIKIDYTYTNMNDNMNSIKKIHYTNNTPITKLKVVSTNGVKIAAYMYTIYKKNILYKQSEIYYMKYTDNFIDSIILNTDNYSDDIYRIKITIIDESGYQISKNSEDIIIDMKEPDIPILLNKYDNKWINKNYSIKGTSSDSSGILEWQYTFKKNASKEFDSNDWNKYSDSAKNVFTTPAFTNEMDKYIYLRACDYANNCSDSSKSKIKIDKTAPICTPPTGGSSTWINASSTDQSRIITATCDDSKNGDTHSGCVENTISHTYNTDIDTKEAGAAGNKNGGIVRDVAGNETECIANQTVRIDKTPPTKPVLNNPNNNKWVNKEKFNSSGFTYTIKGTTTENLSGVKYWQYTYDNNNATWKTYSNSAVNPFTTPTFTDDINKSIFIRVCDNAGNCSEKNSSLIKIDTTPPSCDSWSGESTSWAKSRTISVGCTDSGSQCEKSSYSIASYSSGTVKTANLSQTIKDRAGNTKTCSKNNVNIYVDNDSPSCTSSGGSNNWTNASSVVLTGTCNDNGGSGCKGNAITTYTVEGDYGNQSPGIVCDALDNCKSCPQDQAVKIDRTPPACSLSLDGVSGWNHYTMTCSDSLSQCTSASISGFIDSTQNVTVTDNANNSCSVAVSHLTTTLHYVPGGTAEMKNVPYYSALYEDISPYTAANNKVTTTTVSYLKYTDSSGNVILKRSDDTRYKLNFDVEGAKSGRNGRYYGTTLHGGYWTASSSDASKHVNEYSEMDANNLASDLYACYVLWEKLDEKKTNLYCANGYLEKK